MRARFSDEVLREARVAWKNAALPWPSPDALDEHQDNERARLAAMRAVLEGHDGWQPIEAARTVCQPGEPYLVYHPDWGMSVRWFANKGTYAGFHWRGDEGVPEPTHFMPLPPEPGAASDGSPR